MKKIYALFSLLILSFQFSCTSEPIGKANINQQVVDEELFNFISRVVDAEEELTNIDCIEFNYSFTLFVFDETMELVDTVVMQDNAGFSIFLRDLPENFSISLNYPIAGTLSTGELLEINTNEELRAAIDNCSKDEVQQKCNNTLAQCLWRITELPSFPNDFENDYFKVNTDGTVTFFDGNKLYFGTWVTLYIGDDLFLNIDLNGNPEIEAFFDANWEVTQLTFTSMQLAKDGFELNIKKDCTIPCNSNYRICEQVDEPGFAAFELQQYSGCIGIPGTHDVISPVLLSFFETEEDAILNTNEVSPTTYRNTSNPQDIYVRIAYLETGDVLGYSQFTIEVLNCL